MPVWHTGLGAPRATRNVKTPQGDWVGPHPPLGWYLNCVPVSTGKPNFVSSQEGTGLPNAGWYERSAGHTPCGKGPDLELGPVYAGTRALQPTCLTDGNAPTTRDLGRVVGGLSLPFVSWVGFRFLWSDLGSSTRPRLGRSIPVTGRTPSAQAWGHCATRGPLCGAPLR